MTDREKIEALAESLGILDKTTVHSSYIGGRRFCWDEKDELDKIIEYAYGRGNNIYKADESD